ncbi:MAG: leucine--tRNA ligase [Chthonomonadales bacterium]
MTQTDDRFEFRAIEAKWQQRWEAAGLFRAEDASAKPKFYGLEMFPYPSGAGLSVGHIKNYAPTDAFCRYKAMRGFNVLHPMGWDAFGQPAENEAIRRGRNPREMVPEYAANYRRTLIRVGCAYDWSREINSSSPAYYRWTQWMFLLLYHRGLAYRAHGLINWCPSCKTGLANEEVKEGRCWRCDTQVEKRSLPQWYFRITAYADRLLNDLDKVDWPSGLKEMQRDWIGRSEGAEITFRLMSPLPDGSATSLSVFTTRPDTLWGATFMVLAPEHPLVSALTTTAQKPGVDAYIRRSQAATEIERMSAERAKTGVFTGSYALNPVTGARIPIWIADYVLMGYGTGAIMAVPAHDQRDFEFARKYGLPVELVYQMDGGPTTGEQMDRALPEGGVMRAFVPPPGSQAPASPFAGLPNNQDTVRRVIRWLEENGIGKGTVTYRLRDWLISRQRYWGAPIPMVHCGNCGTVPVPEEQLPVLLPDVESYQPTGTGESPLANIPEFVEARCPNCGGEARRETDTMGGYACSSWYFLRFADPHNDKAFADREKLDYWLPVDLYTGGVEHARSHLLYARFFTKVLFDAGYVGFDEPFLTLRNQGSMLAWTPGRRPRAGESTSGEEGDEAIVDWIVLKPEERSSYPQDQIVWRWARMSKSKGNVVTPDDVCNRYGADSLRIYEMFVAPFEENVQWSEEGIRGAYRFLSRVWRWCVAVMPAASRNWRAQLNGQDLPDATRSVRRKIHQTIRTVTADVEAFRFNTAIAAIMELVNTLYTYQPIDVPIASSSGSHAAVLGEALETLILLLAPFTPHLADELWERMGMEGFTYRAAWPQFNDAIACEDEITVVVQVNGKVRDRLLVPAHISNEELREMALRSTRAQTFIGGKPVRNVIVVPGKLVNIVVK